MLGAGSRPVGVADEAGCALRRTLLAVRGPRSAGVAAGAPSPLSEVLVLDDNSATPAEDAVRAAGGVEVPRGATGGAAAPLRWVRSATRLGVARARTAAARAARAPVLVFLDAHCEPQTGWLPPLLALLAARPQAVALPVLETIDARTWAYRPAPMPAHPPRGVLADWNLSFGWRPLNATERAAREAGGAGGGAGGADGARGAGGAHGVLAPLASPVMAGGVFAMRADWFFASGGYDDGLEVWGVENVEMSLRVWTCGGGLYTLPCSRVGHVFRHAQPFTWPNASGALTVRRNAWRVAAVWMDDVAPVVGAGLTGGAARAFTSALRDAPGLAARHALRRRLGCQSFRWYLQHVHPDHPPLPADLR